MPQPAVILFDDGLDLAPLTDLRASFELRTGAVTTIERLTRQLGSPVAALYVPRHLAALVGSRWTLPVNAMPDGESFLLINGRSSSLAGGACDMPIGTAMVSVQGEVIVAHLDRQTAGAMLAEGKLHPSVKSQAVNMPLIAAPWQLLDHVRMNLSDDLADCPHPAVGKVTLRGRVVGDHDVKLSKSATVHPMVAFDCSAGHIIIDDHAVVEPLAVLHGPCYIGPHTTVVSHAHIRPFSVIGGYCKVGGEISSSIIHSHSNKSHYGYLGHSIIGQWVNLGAGTTTSNLKNTYGEVTMRTRADVPAQPTGVTFLGSIVGDHVKTAIGSRLNTGTCISTGAMIASSGITPKFFDRFAFVTDQGIGKYDLRKFFEMAGRMMQRRDRALSQAEIDRLTQLYSTMWV